eukprot:4077558-Pyramimonas_sp.AAC.1
MMCGASSLSSKLTPSSPSKESIGESVPLVMITHLACAVGSLEGVHRRGSVALVINRLRDRHLVRDSLEDEGGVEAPAFLRV